MPDPDFIYDTAVEVFKDNFYNKYDVDKYTAYIADIYRVWYVMAICVLAAFVIGIIYLLILRCCAGVIIWTSIFTILVVIGGGGYWSYITKNNYDPSDKNYMYLQYGAYILWGIDAAFLLVVFICCSRIRLAVAIMKVTSQFIYNTPTVLFIPIIFMIISAVWILAWCFTALFLMSVGDIKPREAPFTFATDIVWSK